MKKLFRPIAVAFAKRLLNWLREAESQVLISRLKSCGRNVDLYYPLCINGAENVEVGDNVAIGSFTHIFGQGGLRIGNRVMIASHNAITTLTHDYRKERIQGTLIRKPVIIEDDVWIGAHCTILPGVTIGKGAVVGAGSVVTKNVEPYAIVVGTPARLLKYRDVAERLISKTDYSHMTVQEADRRSDLPTEPLRLLDYAANVYSKNGEDGILLKILELLPVRDKWCVEFGAWDGKHLSNTCNLVENHGYCSVMIESDKQRFADLLKNHGSNRNVIAINKFVGFTRDDNLDNILSDKTIPRDFDLLSIDIEGNDYHAWDAILSYTPKVVRIAFNPTIPTEVEFVQPADINIYQGSSLLALVRLANRKGYELVCVTHRSAIFVHSTYFSLFGITNNDPRELRKDLSSVTH